MTREEGEMKLLMLQTHNDDIMQAFLCFFQFLLLSDDVEDGMMKHIFGAFLNLTEATGMRETLFDYL